MNDDDSDDEFATAAAYDGAAHWGHCPYDSLAQLRQQVSDQFDDLCDVAAPVAIGARFVVDAALDCRVEFFAGDGTVGGGDSLFVLARDRRGVASATAVRALFDYLIDDLRGVLQQIDYRRIDAVFGDGERPLALLGGDGLPLDLAMLDPDADS